MIEWSARRLVVQVGGRFDDAVAQYQSAVPVFPAERFERLVAVQADWAAVLEETRAVAPHGFLRYWSFPADPLMSLAGNSARCTAYLMGNHTVVERMYRHDPAVFLYAPLRTAITQVPGGPVRFSVEQPSREFASFGPLSVAAVGTELDHMLAALLEALGWAVPAPLSVAGA
ncbi:hypothetical protein [Dactylosporangium sp. NPDC051541]|uniref:hypothetical protein n=1 Tax=Dactylosporangium sp. NPDC051541 TaxID=3363977 RepID=UPI0037A597DE